jgi:SAM-dependent methyltransferase
LFEEITMSTMPSAASTISYRPEPPMDDRCLIAPSLEAVASELRTAARLQPGWRVLDLGVEAAATPTLPFATAAFDAVVWAFGVGRSPDPAATARELLRVTRPGGTIALAAPTTSIWGSEPGLRLLLGRGLDYLDMRDCGFRFDGRAGAYLQAVGLRRPGR